MWTDEIVEEVRRQRSKISEEFHHDIDAIVAHARERQLASGHKTVAFPPRTVDIKQLPPNALPDLMIRPE